MPPTKEWGRHELADQRSQKQADNTIDRRSEGQIELGCEALEHRSGDLPARTGFVTSYVPGRHDRTQQVQGALNSVERFSQAMSALERGCEGFRIRRLDSA